MTKEEIIKKIQDFKDSLVHMQFNLDSKADEHGSHENYFEALREQIRAKHTEYIISLMESELAGILDEG